ncbi:MAG: hypothetical protein RMZ69_26110 [Nostoc sp. ChiQUE01a]|nr:hypothetical protein [Nostoc sp. ChiQUE01a]
MAIATRTETTLSPTITQTSLVNAIKTAFINAGYSSLYDEFVSGTDQVLVYEWINDSTKNFGKVYLRIRVTTALLIGQQLYAGWNTGTHTGTNGSTEATYSSFSSSTTILLNALNGAEEYKFVFLSQGSTLVPLGIITPFDRPGWWDLNSWAYGFFFTTSSPSVLRGVATAALPYSSTDFDTFLTNSRMSSVNPQTSKPDIIKGLLLLTQSSSGVGGATSEDLAIGAFNGQTRLSIVAPLNSSQEYLILSNVTGGLGIRIA